MFKPTLVSLTLGLSALLLAGCTTKSEPQGEAAPQRDASPSVTAKGGSSKAASP